MTDINTIVNVSTSSIPKGLTTQGLMNLAIFTEEIPNNADVYRVYYNATDVATDYGTSATITQMAQRLFLNKFLQGQGTLFIIPLVGTVNATIGQSVSADLSSNLTALKLVSDGDITISVDGTEYNLTGLNFTTCTSIKDVAQVIQNKIFTLLITEENNKITYKSKTAGSLSIIEVKQLVGGTGTDLSAITLLDTASNTQTDGIDATGETLQEAFLRIKALPNALQPSFTALTSTLYHTPELIASNGTAFGDEFMYFDTVASSQDFLAIQTLITDAGLEDTRPLYYGKGAEENKILSGGYIGEGRSVDYSSENKALSMHLKPLKGVEQDPTITPTLELQLQNAGIDYYTNVAGLNVIYSTGANQYYDKVQDVKTFRKQLQIEVFNYAATTTTKIPQTQDAMDSLLNFIAIVCQKYVTNGVFAPGSWNGAVPISNEEAFLDGISTNGFYISAQPISSQTQTERESRKAPSIQIYAKLSGAIHSIAITLNIQD